MSSEKIPCPVDGCDKSFDTMEETAAHMKEVHKQEFGAPEAVIPPGGPPAAPAQAVPEAPKSLGVVPGEVLEYFNSMVDHKVQAALEAERPKTVKAVGQAIAAVISDIQKAGITIPGVTGLPGAPAKAGPTDLGAQVIAYITRPEPGGDLTAFIKQAQQFRAIGELFNPPPGLADRIITSAYIKNLKKLDLVTDKAAAALDKELFPDGLEKA